MIDKKIFSAGIIFFVLAQLINFYIKLPDFLFGLLMGVSIGLIIFAFIRGKFV